MARTAARPTDRVVARHNSEDGRHGVDPLRALLVLPPARISHGPDTFRAMPDCELIVVADRPYPAADRSIVLPARRAPLAGRSEHWTAALAWLRGLSDIDPGTVDIVASLEL